MSTRSPVRYWRLAAANASSRVAAAGRPRGRAVAAWDTSAGYPPLFQTRMRRCLDFFRAACEARGRETDLDLRRPRGRRRGRPRPRPRGREEAARPAARRTRGEAALLPPLPAGGAQREAHADPARDRHGGRRDRGVARLTAAVAHACGVPQLLRQLPAALDR